MFIQCRVDGVESGGEFAAPTVYAEPTVYADKQFFDVMIQVKNYACVL